jgi:hypothetical protein
MSARGNRRPMTYELLLFIAPSVLLVGCSRAPSVDVLGSFFPAWLLCLIVAILLTAFARLALLSAQTQVAFPVLVYPSLVALFTFALWLIFFR